jgi:hypothetical protein
MRAMPCLALAALTLAALPLAHGQSVSVNATITGEVVPGVYGQLVLGNRPPPPVVYAQPVIAQPPAVVPAVPVAPIYLHVPPEHARDWARHCREYHACNRPVYFVKSAEYEPGYRPDHHHEDYARHDDEHDRDHERGHRDD